jgi:hypothetical protein
MNSFYELTFNLAPVLYRAHDVRARSIVWNFNVFAMVFVTFNAAKSYNMINKKKMRDDCGKRNFSKRVLVLISPTAMMKIDFAETPTNKVVRGNPGHRCHAPISKIEL